MSATKKTRRARKANPKVAPPLNKVELTYIRVSLQQQLSPTEVAKDLERPVEMVTAAMEEMQKQAVDPNNPRPNDFVTKTVNGKPLGGVVMTPAGSMNGDQLRGASPSETKSPAERREDYARKNKSTIHKFDESQPIL